MQGENFSSTLCTGTLNPIITECKIEPYLYRNSIEIPKMVFLDDILDISKCGRHTKEIHEFTNNELTKRKFQMSIDKCKRMHFGKQVSKCEDLFIDKWSVKCEDIDLDIFQRDTYEGKILISDTDSYQYLGEWITNSGSNKLNIDSKINKCQGVINDITFILNSSYYGDHFFEIVKLLRSSMFLSVLTSQCEIWPKLTKRDLQRLESCDNRYLNATLGSSSSYCLKLLEGGILPIRFIIISK